MEINFNTEQYQLQFKPHVLEDGHLIITQFAGVVDGVDVIIDPRTCTYTDMEQLYLNGNVDLFDIVPKIS